MSGVGTSLFDSSMSIRTLCRKSSIASIDESLADCFLGCCTRIEVAGNDLEGSQLESIVPVDELAGYRTIVRYDLLSTNSIKALFSRRCNLTIGVPRCEVFVHIWAVEHQRKCQQ